MTFEECVKKSPGRYLVKTSATSAAEQYEGDSEPTHAILFNGGEVDPVDIDDEYEAWLETAEDEMDDDDLVLCGHHPIDEGTQVERMFFFRKSEGGRVVYAMDVDGTAVPGTLDKFSDDFGCFEPA